MENKEIPVQRINSNIGLDSAKGLMPCNESAVGVASSVKTTQQSTSSQTTMVKTTSGNEQVSAGGLFTSSQTPNKK